MVVRTIRSVSSTTKLTNPLLGRCCCCCCAAAATTARYLYTGTIPQECSPEVVMKLAVLANEYMLTRLVTMCEGTLMRLVEDDNVIEMLQ